MTFKLIFATVLVGLIAGCSSNPTQPVTPDQISKMLIASRSSGGYKVELYADSALSVGYNVLFIRTHYQGNVLHNAGVTINPDMDMGMYHHSCPVEQPSSSVAGDSGLYSCASVFTMPSDSAWIINVTVEDPDRGNTVQVTLPITVKPAKRVYTFRDTTAGIMYVASVVHKKPVVGMNDISFLLHSTTDKFVFIPVNNATIVFDPSMPSMGHGSYGNVQPGTPVNGWYSGRVNYSMSGDWLVTASITLPSGLFAQAPFPVYVP
ncbi:MAG: hypothetical protein D8M52_04325 [Chlorobi bacterium]|nr:MAG: hypothetical protein F9K28_03460 [Bacteroidota bacterium]KXK34627.1 MAG: hypothetical protein UZ06_CHB003001090 [Chlorobi bacterium OLB6]MBE2265909.1 FixH family protein [Flavobacteriales bacterium]MBL1160930.1 hypothetical protein [Chlorobiota bacterium]MBW7852891.1 FixH family protein [Candidatus Kapabacteria bacterium]MCC6330878.1 FixH family protein [Ignavibacteria bacterium]